MFSRSSRFLKLLSLVYNLWKTTACIRVLLVVKVLVMLCHYGLILVERGESLVIRRHGREDSRLSLLGQIQLTIFDVLKNERIEIMRLSKEI